MTEVANEPGSALVEVRDLALHFPVYKGVMRRRVGSIKAIDGISFNIYPGETLALVGESGCGKSSTGRSLLRLDKPTAGNVLFENHDMSSLDAPSLRALRPRMQMIFQDPEASLNPRMTVASIIAEPLQEHQHLSTQQIHTRVIELLESVGLEAAHVNRYPHEFSGGQRQRIGIARALALRPSFIVCDEPIAALDVSIQAQVVNLLDDLQEQFALTYLFISHDLSMVRHIADRVAVMYLGKIMELATIDDLFNNPEHPYTQALLSAVPIPDPKIEATRQRVILSGDTSDANDTPGGCAFGARCHKAIDICFAQEPLYRQLENGTHVACHRV
jgi:oligopeptide transport system ATP-binding protein